LYARTIAHGVVDRALEAAASNHLGILALEDGRLGMAGERFESALRVREAGSPRLTDDAWVYLAGTMVNLGNTKLAAWDATGAADLYGAAIARLNEARDAGSRTGALEPFLTNARRGAAAATKLATLVRPKIGVATVAAPLRTDGLVSPAVRELVERY